MIESFNTLHCAYGPEEFKEKGSRFISYAYPVTSQEAVDAIIGGLWKRYHDATHVCYAFRLGNGAEKYFRYNDDGEPSGSAGLPIYNEIKSKSYFNVLVAVVRYYGGTKLGTGGLVRAYGKGAKDVLEVAKPVTVHIKQAAVVVFPFGFTGEMMQMVSRFGIDILAQDFTAEGIHMKLDIPIARVDEVKKNLTDRSSGKISLKIEP